MEDNYYNFINKNMGNSVLAIDPNLLAKRAMELRKIGLDINNNLTKAYDDIVNLHNDWHGKGYGKLCDEFNKLVTDINKTLDFVVTKVPFYMEKIANLFSVANEDGMVVKPTEEPCKTVTLLHSNKQESLHFQSEQVQAIRQKVSNEFVATKELMNTYIIEFFKLEWNNGVAKQFALQLKLLASRLENGLYLIEQKFDYHMNATIENMNAVERMNSSMLG